MQTLGILDEERLFMLPKNYWSAHEFCFYLHDKLVELLKEYDSNGVQNTVADAFYKTLEEHGKLEEFENVELISYMKEAGLDEPYKHHIVSHIVMALTADMLHYLYEALMCLEKRKFSVAFTLLRKPLKEHLFFLSWVLADEGDFISRFEADNYKSFSSVTKEKRIEIIEGAISKLHVKEAFDAEIIWNYVYSKKHENGFEPTWQQATHLTTSHGELLKTQDYSLNFIFENSYDDYYYDFLRDKLPYIFIYISQITLAAFNRVRKVNKRTVNHLILTTMGCYESIFLDGRCMSIGRMLQKQLGDFLSCVHCEAPFKIKKRNAPLFYLHEQFLCENCGTISDFPLFWVMAKAEMEFSEDNN